MDHTLALMSQFAGIVLMTAALLWAGTNVWRQFSAWRRQAESTHQ